MKWADIDASGRPPVQSPLKFIRPPDAELTAGKDFFRDRPDRFVPGQRRLKFLSDSFARHWQTVARLCTVSGDAAKGRDDSQLPVRVTKGK